MAMRQESVSFNFYGFIVQVLCASETARTQLALDFGYFLAEPMAQPSLLIRQENLEPDVLAKPGWRLGKTRMCGIWQRSLSQRLLIYDLPGTYLLDTQHKTHREMSIQAADEGLFDEIASIAILSAVGENLDARGMMRLHSASLRAGKTNVCFWGRRGAGKSTISVAMLQSEKIQIFSDEVSLLNLKTKELLPFPIRIAVRQDQDPALKMQLGLDGTNSRKPQRRLLDQKSFVDIPKDRVSNPGQLSQFFWMRFSSDKKNKISKLGFFESCELYLWIFLGMDLIQMAELLLRASNLKTQFLILINRIRLCFYIAKQTPFSWSRSAELSEDRSFILNELSQFETAQIRV